MFRVRGFQCFFRDSFSVRTTKRSDLSQLWYVLFNFFLGFIWYRIVYLEVCGLKFGGNSRFALFAPCSKFPVYYNCCFSLIPFSHWKDWKDCGCEFLGFVFSSFSWGHLFLKDSPSWLDCNRPCVVGALSLDSFLFPLLSRMIFLFGTGFYISYV